jgi:hypothetical protein
MEIPAKTNTPIRTKNLYRNRNTATELMSLERGADRFSPVIFNNFFFIAAPNLEQMLEPDMGIEALHPRIYG